MSNKPQPPHHQPVRVTGAFTPAGHQITVTFADGMQMKMLVSEFKFDRDPATICGRDGCATPVCEPYSTDNPWAAALCEVHVDTSFRCDDCREWKSEDDHASGPDDPAKVVCETCHKINLRDNPVSHRYPATI